MQKLKLCNPINSNLEEYNSVCDDKYRIKASLLKGTLNAGLRQIVGIDGDVALVARVIRYNSKRNKIRHCTFVCLLDNDKKMTYSYDQLMKLGQGNKITEFLFDRKKNEMRKLRRTKQS